MLKPQTLLGVFAFFLLTRSSAQDVLWRNHFWSKNYYWGMLNTVDPAGNLYASAYIGGPAEIDTVLDNHLTNPGKGQYIYKVDSTGKAVWAKMALSGVGSIRVNALHTDQAGSVYLAGFFTGSVDFDPGPGTQIFNTLVSQMYFIQKLDPDGNLVWARQINTHNANGTANVTGLDADGNLVITGNFQGVTDFDPGPGEYNLTGQPAGSEFLLKLTGDGDFIWVKQFEKVGVILASHLDADGNWIFRGSVYQPSDLDPGPDTFMMNAGYFFLKLDSDGGFIWARLFDQDVEGYDTDASGNLVIIGEFEDTVDFDPGPGEVWRTAPFGQGNYVTKWNKHGEFQWVNLEPKTQNAGVASQTVEIAPDGGILLAGPYLGTFDIDPGPAPHFISTGSGDLGYVLQALDATGKFIWERHIAYVTVITVENEYFLQCDNQGNLYARTTFREDIFFTIDSSNITHLFAYKPPLELEHLVFKMQLPGSSATDAQDLPENEFDLFPNPVPAYTPATLLLPDSPSAVEIVVRDMQGLLVKRLEWTTGSSRQDLPGLPSGLYVVEVRTARSAEVKLLSVF